MAKYDPYFDANLIFGRLEGKEDGTVVMKMLKARKHEDVPHDCEVREPYTYRRNDGSAEESD